jgi:serine/threonine protein kinase
MTRRPDKVNEEELDALLAEYDQALAEGNPSLVRSADAALPEFQARLARLKAILERLERDRRGPQTASPRPNPQPTSTHVAALATKFARYRVVSELGQGGMGIVYKAYDTQLEREVALKVMKLEIAVQSSAAERFLREARVMAAIRHDHVVEIYDYGEIDGVCFAAMPLLRGESLESRLGRKNRLPPREVARIGAELASGLDAVHQQGIIHRDLKPSNVWLEAPSSRVKLLDFGLARDPRAGNQLTRTGDVIGTPAYMSPEQVNGLPVGAQTDLFSLGSILYRAATGRLPFPGPTLSATLAAVGEKDAPPVQSVTPDVPVGLSDLIERLHRKDPAQRPPTAAEVSRELSELAVKFSQPEARLTPQRRRSWVTPVRTALALSLLLFFGAVWSRFNGWSPQPEESNHPSVSGPNEVAEPVRIRALDVLHTSVEDQGTRPRGALGKESFGAVLGDEIVVTTRLSRPAYCYLIIFRPDGVNEVLFPQGANDVPELTDEPRYPTKDRSKVYGLTEGTGLWLVALVASETRLPPYAEWQKKHAGCPWAKSSGEADVVWLDDGQWPEAVTPRGLRTRGTRGQHVSGAKAPIVNVVDWLKAETGGVVSAVAFTVESKNP